MEVLRRSTALLLALALAASPAAAAQTRLVLPTAPAPAAPVVAPPVLPNLSLSLSAPSLAAPTLAPALSPLPAVAGAAPKAALALPSAAAALAAPARPAVAVRAEEPKSDFAKKVSAIAAGVAEAVKAVDAPSPDGGRGAAEQVFSKLSGQTVISGQDEDFSPGQLQAVKATSGALERGVAKAAGSVIPGSNAVRSRGSSARLTHAEENPDYDIMVKLDRPLDPEALPALKAALAESVKAETAALFPGVETKVVVGGPVQLNDPADHKKVDGVTMLPVQVLGPKGVLADADVTFTARPEYANDYPAYFDAQLAALGPQADAAVADIRLAKRFFKEVLGSYKAWQGGPSGVGVEQMVLQAGGSFDAMLERLHAVAFEADGAKRGVKKARRSWLVKNPFMAPANFLDLVSEKAWAKLAYAAKTYHDAKAAGLSVSLDSLRPAEPAPAPIARPAERRVPVNAVAAPLTPSLAFTTGLRFLRAKTAFNAAVKRLKEHGLPVENAGFAARRGGYTLTLQLPAGADAAEAMAELGALLRRADPKAGVEPEGSYTALTPSEGWVFLRPRGGGRDTVERAAEKLARRLRLGRVEIQARPGGVYAVGFALRGKAPEAFAAEAVEFFKKPSGAELVSVGLPAKAAAAKEPVGALTLDMLTRFTQDGPAPAQRGDAFLYAQGAKALPEGLEEAGRARSAAPLHGNAVRTMFYRRNGRAYVMLDDPEAEGPFTQRPVKVPARLAQGIVTDTVVEVVGDLRGVTALRSVGAYAADVFIGRVTKVGGELRLAPLFGGDAAKALYEPLPLSAAAREGNIVQAFVRPAGAGYEAVPLIDLGTQLTPEVAAREIALRHGARSYFEADVIAQAEAVGRSQDPEADFKRMQASKGKSEDLRALPFVTIDPPGAGDLDDAYFAQKEKDGSYTWYLATADVAQYVKPGTPAFRAAARVGNTFYSVDKEGVPEYPMNHPVVSKSVSSLLAGKDSLAMVTKMRFSAAGEFLLDESEVFLGLVRVQGRYTYPQVAALWRGEAGHGIAHVEQVALARELAAKLDASDGTRGKLKLSFPELRHAKGPDGRWSTVVVPEDPLEKESHRLIEELKVYGNRAIALRLEAVAKAAGAPHISRVHPAQDEKSDARLRKELSAVGAPWRSDETLWQYLGRLKGSDLRPEVKETAQLLALRSRASARYSVDDAEGHEGLALAAKAYDHPSTPIRRFSDMYNRALLEADLEGGDAKAVYAAVLADLKAMGFASLDEYLEHLNGREQAARRMDREFDEFMSVYELAKPENRGRTFTGYVKLLKEGRNAEAVIQFRESPATLTLRGEAARRFRLLSEVTVTVRGADVSRMSVDAAVRVVSSQRP